MGLQRFFIHRDEAVLVLVDVQEKLASAMPVRAEVTRNCLRLLQAAGVLGIPVLVTEQYPGGLGPTVPELREAVPGYSPIEKLCFGCAEEPAFREALTRTGREKVVLTGMETHVCVWQTGLGLLRDGYGVHLVSDAVCSRTKENWRLGLALARDAGAVVSSTETVLFQLMERAGTEEFKAISKLIK
ncbi:MAG: hydrolase [Nitrospirota bacterium]